MAGEPSSTSVRLLHSRVAGRRRQRDPDLGVPQLDLQALDLLGEQVNRPTGGAYLGTRVVAERLPPGPQAVELLLGHAGEATPPDTSAPGCRSYPDGSTDLWRSLWIRWGTPARPRL